MEIIAHLSICPLNRQQLTIDSIKTTLPSANVRKLILDLSSFDAIRAAAAEVNAYSEPIHVSSIDPIVNSQ
jgi:hypothetical protein